MARVSLVALLALLVAVPAAQGRATTGGVTMVARDLPVGGERSLASTRAPDRFDMVGLRWHGPGTVRFRTRSLSGRWGSWQAPDDENPSWVGASDALQYRVHGRVARLRAYYIWSPVEHTAFRRLSVAGSPPIVSRTAWGADELLRRNHPRYAPEVRLVFVHHTATLQRVHARPGGGHRSGDRRLPRPGQGLGRHRLQLPRRPLRPCLRGPRRRDDAERHRRARPRVQHGQRRDRGDRQFHDGQADVLGASGRWRS